MLLYSQNANRDLNILGLLMQDFFCTKPAQMHYPQLAQRADFFKHKPEGMKAMCEIMEKLQEAGRAEGLAQGEKMRIVALHHACYKKINPSKKFLKLFMD